MQVIVNGQLVKITESISILALLESMQLAEQRVAVELNSEVIPKARHAQTVLHEGDRVEIVTFVGGG